jgi:phospholipase C
MITLVAACGVDASPTITVDDSPAPGMDESSGDEDVDATPITPIYWATNGVADEAGSTHLWIVDRAGDVLGQHAEGARARNWLLNTTCKPRWEQGLYDADYRAKYNGGWFDLTPTSSTVTIGLSGATWASHFYDPDTGKNYKGQTSPTAKTEALAHSASAKTLLANGDLYNGCYELGLALHYFTDLTQPMHASNYTATNVPTSLHTHVEEYALNLQTDGAPTGWTSPSGTTAQFIDAAGRRSKAQWPALKSAIASVYGARCWPFSTYILDHTDCWQADPTVDAKIRSSMASAINDTASFLVSVQLP